MSILIRGMEMPENCYLCRLGDQGFGVKCRIVGGTYANDSNKPSSRPPWCPLIEVPTPHGRLIDADEFFDKIPSGDIEHDEKISRTGAIADVCTWVLSAPTVIEAEEGI